MDKEEPAVPAGHGATEFKPGETISPHTDKVVASTQATATPSPITPPEAEVTLPELVAPVDSPAPEVDTSTPLTLPEIPADDVVVSWTASEFIAHSKTPLWYVVLSLSVVAFTAIVFLLTRDLITSVIILLAGVAFGVYGARQPRQLQYALSENGLLVASRYFPFSIFRSFAVVEDGAFSSLLFMPLKRFGQIVTVYYDPADEERIMDLLATRLPMERRTPDTIDRLMRRIRF